MRHNGDFVDEFNGLLTTEREFESGRLMYPDFKEESMSVRCGE